MSAKASHFEFVLPETVAHGAWPTTEEERRSLLSSLSTQVDSYLQAEVARRVATAVAEKIRLILEQIRLARQQRFGAHSESNLLQGRLFNEAKQAADPSPDTAEVDLESTERAASPRKSRGQRHPLPPELPRVEVVLDVSAEQRQCDECDTPMIRIGEEVSEQLNIVPMRIEVIRTVRPRYACPAHHGAPVGAPAPPTALPRTHFAPGFLATLLTMKYVDGLPLARFEKVLARHGVDVPRPDAGSERDCHSEGPAALGQPCARQLARFQRDSHG